VSTASAPEGTEPPRSPDEVPALLIGGVALASLVAGAVYGVIAWQDHEDFLANPTSDTANRGQFNAFMADMCFATAASLGIVSALMFIRPEPDAPVIPQATSPKPRLSLSTFVSGHGGGAAAVIRW
jgi:hypothetical protein